MSIIDEKQAKVIVKAIEADLSDRRGLRHEWDAIDADIKREIRRKWVRLVRETEA